MEPPNYTNWDNERGALIEEILEILRQQTDDNQEARIAGSFTFNPSAFSRGSHLVLGPFNFSTQFQGAPIVTFGQQPFLLESEARVSNKATNYKPFLVQPYVLRWNSKAGAVEGFWIGLYALSKPTSISNTHTIFWAAQGSASRYKKEGLTEAWTSARDPSEPTFLVDDL